jgi:hypothetical protein
VGAFLQKLLNGMSVRFGVMGKYWLLVSVSNLDVESLRKALDDVLFVTIGSPGALAAIRARTQGTWERV